MGYVCPSTNPISAILNDYCVPKIGFETIEKDIITSIRNNVDHIIVNLHWGTEEVNFPKPEDIIMARKIIDLGADLIIGHHSHCIQPFEVYNGKYIFYGLGNCIMPNINVNCRLDMNGASNKRFIKIQNSWNKYSLIVKYNLSNRNVDLVRTFFNGNTLEIVPTKTNNFILKRHNIDWFSKKYKRARLYCTIKKYFVDYYNKPKIPRIKHMKSIISAIFKKRLILLINL